MASGRERAIEIRLSLAGSERAAHEYRVAGLRCVSDVPIPQLAPFEAPNPTSVVGSPPAAIPVAETRRVYAGAGWVGGRLRKVESRSGRAGYRLRIEDAGKFTVTADGGVVHSDEPLPERPLEAELGATVLGPCLCLALALQGVWCLHAGAAGTVGTAVAITGESGSGKSTLAAALADAAAGWRRAGDDILPVRLVADGAVALPRFPQPNLPLDQQWRRSAPERLSLAAIYVLEPDSDAVRVRGLTRREAVLALVHHTVAARLFDRELQARHLDFCAELAGRLPVRELCFPRRPDAMPAMIATIRRDAAGW